MREYIATFHSHFGAVRFKKESGIPGVRLMPVPRDLSSSCGTCAYFKAEAFVCQKGLEDAEQVVEVTGNGFIRIYCEE